MLGPPRRIGLGAKVPPGDFLASVQLDEPQVTTQDSPMARHGVLFVLAVLLTALGALGASSAAISEHPSALCGGDDDDKKDPNPSALCGGDDDDKKDPNPSIATPGTLQ